MKMHNFVIGTIGIVLLMLYGIRLFAISKDPVKYGIHALGENIVLIEGESVVIKWNANPREAHAAIDKWMRIKAKEEK